MGKQFLGRISVFLASVVAVGLIGASPAASQGPVRDPLNGAFGVIEAALSPEEAMRQVELMGAALSGLAPQRPGVTDTYVLSAGLWNDPVFEKEASEAAAVLAQRFDAGGRTIVLSAGRGAGERVLPAATPNNIQAALGKIGATIDPAEDLVIVFLTSHGGPDGAMALQEKNRMGGALRPGHLRASLAAAGIRHRVVIVSACFSGHFILPFSDPGTVILTAAAADKSSFGCEPSRDWTYFGDALFNHALRGGVGLVEAYDQSLGLIAKWEEDLVRSWDALPAAQKSSQPRPEPSNPQKHVGEAVAPVLARAEAYGTVLNCAAHLTFALDRARASRPLSGLGDASAIQSARSAAETRAEALAAAAGHPPQDVARAIADAAAGVGEVFPTQTVATAERAARCAAGVSVAP